MRKLIFESFRKLLPAGLVMGLFFGIISFIIAASSPGLIGLEGFAPLLLMFPYVGGMVFSLVGFSFLNGREASDLYLSLPYRRRTLYWGIIIAELIWGAIIILFTLLLCSLGLALSGATFLFSFIPLRFFYYLIAFASIVGAMAIGKGLSGTWFYSIAWAIIFAFLPRVIIATVSNSLAGTVDWLNGMYYGAFRLVPSEFFTASWVFTTGSLIDAVKSIAYTNLPEIGSLVLRYLYNAVLAAGYLILGSLTFCKRKGELSGSAAPSNLARHLCSMLFTLGFMLVYSLLVGFLFGKATADWTVMLVIALIIFMVMELIGGKSMVGALKGLLFYAAAVALGAILFYGVGALGKGLLNAQLPTSSQGVSYVYINPDTLVNTSYQSGAAKKVKIYDKQIIEELVQTSQDIYINDINPSSYGEQFSNIIFKMDNALTFTCNIPISDSLFDKLLADEHYGKSLQVGNLPPSEAVLALGSYYGRLNPQERDDIIAIYDTFLQEAKANPSPITHYAENPDVCTMRVWYNLGVDTKQFGININPALAPKTALMFMEYNNSKYGKWILDTDNLTFNSLTLYDNGDFYEKDETYQKYGSIVEADEVLKLLGDASEPKANASDPATQASIILKLDLYYRANDAHSYDVGLVNSLTGNYTVSEDFVYYLCLTEQQAQQFIKDAKLYKRY